MRIIEDNLGPILLAILLAIAAAVINDVNDAGRYYAAKHAAGEPIPPAIAAKFGLEPRP